MFGGSLLQAAGSYFLASDACPLVCEAGLEAPFMVGRAGACPLVRGAVSWPSGEQNYVIGLSGEQSYVNGHVWSWL